MGGCLKEMLPTQNTSYQSLSEKSGEWLTRLNPVPDDGHIVISIGPWLLVPEAQRVKELVLNCCNPVTVGSNRELLQALLPVSHWGPATSMEIRLEDKSVPWGIQSESVQQAFLWALEIHFAMSVFSLICSLLDPFLPYESLLWWVSPSPTPDGLFLMRFP